LTNVSVAATKGVAELTDLLLFAGGSSDKGIAPKNEYKSKTSVGKWELENGKSNCERMQPSPQ
jgi:hypothetical protein